MSYFYVKRKTKHKEERVGGYIFKNGVLQIEDEQIAKKMSHNLIKYYGVKMSDKSPAELGKRK